MKEMHIIHDQTRSIPPTDQYNAIHTYTTWSYLNMTAAGSKGMGAGTCTLSSSPVVSFFGNRDMSRSGVPVWSTCEYIMLPHLAVPYPWAGPQPYAGE